MNDFDLFIEKEREINVRMFEYLLWFERFKYKFVNNVKIHVMLLIIDKQSKGYIFILFWERKKCSFSIYL